MDWKKLRLEEFVLIRKKDLQTIGTVSGKVEWFSKNRFLFFMFGGWMLALVFVVLLLCKTVSFDNRVSLIEKAHAEEVQEHVILNDSLTFALCEKESIDSLMMRCYDIITVKPPKVSHDNVLEFIKSCNPWYPEIIMQQAVQESGCGKSDVAKRCNNLFGMMKPTYREYRCDKNRCNKKEKFAEYEDWRYSVIDRILWEKWYFRTLGRKPSLNEYMNAIDNVYNTETEGYGAKILKDSRKYKKQKTNN